MQPLTDKLPSPVGCFFGKNELIINQEAREMKLNEKIIYCRKQAGMSQVDLADALKVSRQSVSKWETGESNPDIKRLSELAKLFNVSADLLLSETEEEMPQGKNTYPEWLDQIPGSFGRTARRLGWIFGVYLFYLGAVFVGLGSYVRRLNYGGMGIVRTVSLASIIWGIILIIAGIAFVVSLRKWQKKG